jgi:sugar O-acyltransferase (sialic acid O-acetyltransferase NeuD family)
VTTPDVPVLVLGTRTFAEEVADVIGEVDGLRVAAFVENLDRGHPPTLNGLPVLWVDDVAELAGTHRAVCALSTTQRRRYVDQVAALGVPFATVVHPTARVSPTTAVGAGSIVNAGVMVGAHTRIGSHVILNRGALVGHHTEIGDYASIQPGANVAGACSIGEGTYVAMGALVVDHVSVGRGSIVAAGALVTKDVPDNVEVRGVPARVVRENVDGL